MSCCDPADLPAALRAAKGPRTVRIDSRRRGGHRQGWPDGATYHYWTFNRQSSRSLRARPGWDDAVEVTLSQSGRTAPRRHSVDLHAVLGPGGGAAADGRSPRARRRCFRLQGHAPPAPMSITARPPRSPCTSPTACTASFSSTRRTASRPSTRVLRDAERVLHLGSPRRAGPPAVRPWRRPWTRTPSTLCSTVRSARWRAIRAAGEGG